VPFQVEFLDQLPLWPSPTTDENEADHLVSVIGYWYPEFVNGGKLGRGFELMYLELK